MAQETVQVDIAARVCASSFTVCALVDSSNVCINTNVEDARLSSLLTEMFLARTNFGHGHTSHGVTTELKFLLRDGRGRNRGGGNAQGEERKADRSDGELHGDDIAVRMEEELDRSDGVVSRLSGIEHIKYLLNCPQLLPGGCPPW